MYLLSRILFKLSILALIYCAAVMVAMYWPQSCWVLLPIGVVIAKRGRVAALTSHGTARWAAFSDLRRAGMIDARRGLSIGHLLGEEPGRRWAAVKGLFNGRLSAKQACQDLRAAFKKKSGRGVPDRGPIIRLPNAVHLAVFGPSGSGKGVSLIIPYLQFCGESCVVIDPKGENAAITAAFRRDVLGHKTVFIDPHHQITATPDTLNCLDFVNKDSPHAADECRDIAKALIVRNGNEMQPHFDDMAEMVVTAVISMVVVYGNATEGTRSLQTVSDILSHPEKFKQAINVMVESTEWGGLLARLGAQLLNLIDKEKASTLTTSLRHLRFLNTPAVMASTRSSSFDPADLLSGKLTVYLILPPTHMQAAAGLLRVWITTLMRAVVNSGLQQKHLTNVILDEAASLGHLEILDDAVNVYRGYGIRLLFFYQSLGQLQTCFPNGAHQTLLSNATQIFMAVNDVGLPGGAGTADYISARLGEKTIVVNSGGSSSGQSSQWSNGGNQSSRGGGTSSNDNSNWQPQARKLLQPSEVVALNPRVAITFTPGVPPILTWLPRYYEKSQQNIRPGLVAGFGMLVFAALLLVYTGLMAATVTRKALELHKQNQEQNWQFYQPGVPAGDGHTSQRRFYVQDRN
jgi:type IV secretion system protein VirD4